MNCTNLTAVKTYQQLWDFGASSFENCEKLKSITPFARNTVATVRYIGEKAFANTGIEDLYISLSSSATEAWIEPSAFANCKHLKSFTTVRNTFLGLYEFANCTALTSVNIANYHSWFFNNVFENCTSLKTINIPANAYMIGEEAFKGCKSLAAINLGEPSHIGERGFKNNCLSGTAI